MGYAKYFSILFVKKKEASRRDGAVEHSLPDNIGFYSSFSSKERSDFVDVVDVFAAGGVDRCTSIDDLPKEKVWCDGLEKLAGTGLLFSAGLVGLIQLWLPVFDAYAWLIQLVLLIAGSYFTKYMLPAQKEQRTE
ncbi:hypothetical protein [Domibacillus sp.]|uniref:hypothetical protein n=1 Tax=Domibacillus sp. TaxID=1969783 RepID=UPI0028128DA8|nr:hypothetical protein [Domibacillus sp.]